jgi:predicted ATPase
MSSVGLDRTVVFSASGLHGRDPSLTRLHAALSRIEVHLGFDSTAAWAARTLQRPETLRGPTTLFPAERVALLGVNLANAWAELLNRSTAHRDETMATVRLGLGDHVDSVVVVPDRGGGNVYLGLRLKDFEDPILAVNLSDGQLAWLAFIAMARLNDNRSLLAVDEPELHLHPALLGRVVSMLANLLGGAPVVLSTHSDRVLEMLDDPADAVRVCSLEGSRANMSRIDASELPRWMKEFGDVGQLRAAGYLARVLVPILPAASDDEGAE